MLFLDPESEFVLVNQRHNDIAKEIAAFRLGSQPGLRARFDAAVVRLSQGAARRHARRQVQFDEPPGSRTTVRPGA